MDLGNRLLFAKLHDSSSKGSRLCISGAVTAPHPFHEPSSTILENGRKLSGQPNEPVTLHDGR